MAIIYFQMYTITKYILMQHLISRSSLYYLGHLEVYYIQEHQSLSIYICYSER